MPDSSDASSVGRNPPGRALGEGLGRPSLPSPILRRAWGRHALAGAIAFAIIILLVVGWELAARRGWVDAFYVSEPSAIAYQLFDWWHGGTSRGPLATHIGVTLAAAAFGFAGGSLVGALYGFAFRAGTLRGDVVRLLILTFRPAPLVAFAAVLVLGLGFGILARAAFAAALVFLVAAADADARRPALATLRRRCALALAGAVLAECFAARSGVGFLIARSVHQFNAGGVYAAFVVLAVVALIVDAIAGALERGWQRARAGSSSVRA
jgi:NitT/TauT family transport system permease protein